MSAPQDPEDSESESSQPAALRRPPTESSGLARAFAGARPGHDAEEHEALTSVQARLFGVQAAKIRVDRYVLGPRIGRGGMGLVFRAHDPELEREVAIKILKSTIAQGQSRRVARARLAREAQALARISHPNVIPVYDVGTYESGDAGNETDATSPDIPDEGVYVVMELVEGEDAAHWLQQPHGWREVLEVFLAAGRGLAAAHARGLIHRDFKPGNVLIGDDGRVRVLDFGLARSTALCEPPEGPASASTPDDEGGSSSRLTRVGVVMGTPRYMAPEQHRGEGADERSDQFSFCVSLYEAIAGHAAYEDTGGDALSRAKQAGRLAELRNARGAPAWLYRILERGLSPQPGRRYPSMNALLRTIERRMGRRRRASITLALAASIAVAAVGGALIRGPASTPEPQPEAASARNSPAPSARELHDERVAVLPFVDRTHDERLDFAADGLPHLLATELERIEGLAVVGHYRLREHVPDADAGLEIWRATAAALGAGRVVHGELERSAEGVVVRLTLTRSDGAPIATFERSVEVEAIPEAVRALAGELASATLAHEVQLTGSSPRDFAFERALQLGIAALEGDRLDAAQEHLADAARLDPTSGEVHYYRAIVSAWAARPRRETIELIDHALAADLRPHQRAFMAAYRKFVGREFSAAIEAFDEATAVAPDDRYILYGRFEALFHGGRPREAIATYRELCRRSPRFSLGLYHVLEHTAAHRDEEGFAWAMQRARALEWKALPRWEVSRRLFEGDHHKAVEELVRLAAQPHNSTWAPELLVGTYLLADQVPIALALAKQHAERDQRPRGLLPLLAVHVVAGDELAHAQVLERTLATLRSEPRGSDAARSWIQLALMELPRGDEATLRAVSEGLEGALPDPDHPSEFVWLARATFAGALGDGARLDELAGSELPFVRATVEGYAATRAGRHEDAARAWREAIETTPDARFTLVQQLLLARALQAAGDEAGAARTCEGVLDPPLYQLSWGSVAAACRELSDRGASG